MKKTEWYVRVRVKDSGEVDVSEVSEDLYSSMVVFYSKLTRAHVAAQPTEYCFVYWKVNEKGELLT